MSRRARLTLPMARLAALAGILGCSGTGGNGEECTANGSGIFDVSYSCSAGLICNTANLVKPGGKTVCQSPASQGTGAACSRNDLCESGLWCDTRGMCAPRVALGGACPSGVECMTGLVCAKDPTSGATRCVIPGEAGAPEPDGSASAGDAAVESAPDSPMETDGSAAE